MKTKENRKIKGKITIRSYKPNTLAKVKPYMLALSAIFAKKQGCRQEIARLRAKIHSILKRGAIGQICQHNLIMQGVDHGTDLIIQRLNGFLVPPTYDLAINYIAIGTGTATPTNADTQMTAEVLRGVVVYSQDIAFNELELQAFFPDNELPNGTYTEAGSFIGATITPNSGQMFNHALFATPYTKTSGMDTTVEIDITL